jgi:quinol monooxygenase YgiN
MSGRRRRDDGWDDGPQETPDDRRDAWTDPDGRRDPWADSTVDEWGVGDAAAGDPAGWAASAGIPAGADRSRSDRSQPEPGRGGAGGYVSNGAAPKPYTAPAFPSFQLGGHNEKDPGLPGGSPAAGSAAAGYGTDRYGPGAPRGAANGQATAGYNGTANNGTAYNRTAQPDVGYGASRGANGTGYAGPGPGPDAGYGRNGYGGAVRDAAPSFEPGYGQAPATVQVPEFTPAGNDDDDGPSGTPRPIGRLSIYTLHEDKTQEFDRLAERAAEGVRTAEPDTLVYVIHVVPKAPMQRIMYEIYRDRAAFLSHERQPHIRQFAADRAACVLATNVIDLRLKYAKVAALGGAPEVAAPRPNWTPQAAETAVAGPAPATAGYQSQGAATQYQPAQYSAAQYSAAQYSAAQYPAAQHPGAQYPGSRGADGPGQPAQYPGTQYRGDQAQQPAAAASFTPAKDRYPAENRQYAATGREHYPTVAQYDNSANGTYGAGNTQYGTANGYSSGSGYANGGGYSNGNGYQGSNGYSGGSGYQGANGYSSANGYQGANGYSETNGYSGGTGYQGGNGYQGGSGSQNGASSQNAASASPNGAPNANANGYGAADSYPANGAGAYGAQYTPRYREITSGPTPALDPGPYPDNGGRYGGGQPSRPADRDPRPPDQR